MLFLASLVTIVGLASGQIISLGRCNPNVTVQQNFDIPRYAGVWYEMYRYEQSFQRDGDCVTANYTLIPAGVEVNNRMVRNRTEFISLGLATVDPEANGSGKLLVSFDGGNNTGPYWVLTTDYEDYVLIYSCVNLIGNSKATASWILSRTRTLSPQAVLAINPRIEEVDGLDWVRYRKTNQTETACLFDSTY